MLDISKYSPADVALLLIHYWLQRSTTRLESQSLLLYGTAEYIRFVFQQCITQATKIKRKSDITVTVEKKLLMCVLSLFWGDLAVEPVVLRLTLLPFSLCGHSATCTVLHSGSQ